MGAKTALAQNDQSNGFLYATRSLVGLAAFGSLLLVTIFGTYSLTAPERGFPLPTVALFASITVTLGLMRLGSKHPNTLSKIKQSVKYIALIAGIIGALCLLFEDLWVVSGIVEGAGIAALSLMWVLDLCRYTYRMLTMLLPSAATIAALITAPILALGLPPQTMAIIALVLVLATNAIIWPSNSIWNMAGLAITGEQSQKRAITASNDRWTYATIGLDIGFAIGAAYYLFRFSEDIASASAPFPFILFICGAVACAGIFLLCRHNKDDYQLEAFAKDYIALTVALCGLPMTLLATSAAITCVAVLMLVMMVQLIIVAIASIEFIRFEELSPLWYASEESFVAGGATLGLIFTGTCLALTPNLPGFPIAVFVVVTFNIFSQTRINLGSFPTNEFFKSLEDSTATHTQETEPASSPPYINGSPSDEGELIGTQNGAWKRKISLVCEEYQLSPRQSQILEVLAKGRDARYIESHFCISNSTAKSHIYNIYCKLDIHSRQELLDIIESTQIH
ncbi:helix-turn-helix transcriptional regulator [Adlercreutzia sp. R25]|uniref:Helix-turn-helix transcriptional regulator n=1 Tax=Adlercreutzia shanghongiae TaxID=3111773 RepID=A0ABU6J0U9_9ACTN|nr:MULTISPECIES: helix-turn-helix transcriptional regulator [unclassified Adlercreutzia]MEC4273448.1 helix-turn-helix transcriptional regulator [Adlercreutzia sp. R25]MEC4295710.1 helix-turn-helix transcriptional regulator [Adlercreutzia sp. R22]